MKKNISMILIFVLVAATLVGCGGSDLEDGTYMGTADGFGGELEVEVIVEEGAISSVEVTENDETPEYAETALTSIPEAIVEANSTDVDGESGATVTSEAIIEAVNNALESDAQ